MWNACTLRAVAATSLLLCCLVEADAASADHRSRLAASTVAVELLEVVDSHPDGRPVRIVAVYGRRQLTVGKAENYRARTAAGAEQPVIFRWSMGDGTRAVGNNVTHRYERPGRYRIIVTARNAKGTDSDTTFVDVVAASPRGVALGASGAQAVLVDPSVSTSAATEDKRPGVPGGGIAASPRNPVESALEGGTIDWSRGGYGLLVATHFASRNAEAEAFRFRDAGFRVGIITDDSGRGSTVYRVLVGQFSTEEAAVEGRRLMLRRSMEGAFLVHRLPTPAD